MRSLRNRYLLLADLLLIPLTIYLSFLLRVERPDLAGFMPGFVTMISLAILAIPLFMIQARIYQQHWRYASMHEVLALAQTISLAFFTVTILMFLAFLVMPELIIPRSTPWIAWPLLIGALCTPRIFQRSWLRRKQFKPAATLDHALPVLIMGAGDAGALTLRELQHNPALNMRVVGLLDDDQRKRQMSIQGVPVIGGREDIPRLVDEYEVRRVIIAMPRAPGKEIREIVQICQKVGVETLTVPGLYELLSGTLRVNQLRTIEITDLLRRAPVETDIAAVRQLIQGRRVLITGGGGSIGSELCRQILHCEPAELIVLGHGENSVFEILNELQRMVREGNWSQVPTTRAVIADIRDLARIRGVFERYRPAIVFHAAAHKHVPLMEENPVEAITNNILGTRNLLDVALECGIERFVMVSSDKAVNPTSVMGATKRVAEMLVHQAARKSGRAFVAVRFGNVLGSRGSVVQTFKRQIAAGGPVTVTDPEMRRYFMTIPEAVQLLLQAAVLGTNGEVFMLDMGEPVKVVDLARDMIRLSGLEVGRDIDIAYSGIRPGEKLFEELFAEGESYRSTQHEKVFVAANASSCVPINLLRAIKELEQASLASDDQELIERLHSLVPEYLGGSTVQTRPVPSERALSERSVTVRVAYGD